MRLRGIGRICNMAKNAKRVAFAIWLTTSIVPNAVHLFNRCNNLCINGVPFVAQKITRQQLIVAVVNQPWG